MDMKTFLCCAVNTGNENRVKRIMGMYTDTDDLRSDCGEALHNAVGNRDMGMVRLLLDAGANVNATEKKGGLTPLHAAVKLGDIGLVHYLLRKNADVNVMSRHQSTALFMAVEKNCRDIARLILSYKPDVNAKKYGRNALYAAVSNENLEMSRMLISKGCRINDIGLDGGTVLHAAVETKSVNMVVFLLENGAITKAKRLGETPLCVAVRLGFVDTAETLLRSKNFERDFNDEAYAAEMVNVMKLALKHRNKQMVYCLLRNYNRNVKLLVPEMWRNSLLHHAVKAAWDDVVEMLLVKGAPVNAVTSERRNLTALHLALKLKIFPAAQRLMEWGADVNVCEMPSGLSPLHMAVVAGSAPIVKMMISRGADVNACNRTNIGVLQLAFNEKRLDLVEMLMSRGARADHACYGRRPMEIAIECGWHELAATRLLPEAANSEPFDGETMLSHAVCNRDLRMVKLLLEAGAKVTVPPPRGVVNPLVRGQTPVLVQAIQQDCEPAIVEALLDFGASADSLDPRTGMSALQLAVVHLAEESVRMLLARGAMVDFALSDGSTALLLAFDACHRRLVDMLLNSGADPTLRRPGCPSPLQRAISLDWHDVVQLMIDRGAMDNEADRSRMAEPLRYAVSKADASMFFELLALGADPGAATEANGRTLLHIAATSHSQVILEELLDYGLPVDGIDFKAREGLTALHVALLHGNEETALTLLDRGASANLRELLSDRTALHLAAETGCLQVATRLLAKSNLNVDDIDNHGLTALQIAAMCGHSKIAELLLGYGADVDLISGPEHYSALHCAICHLNYRVVEVLLAAGALIFSCACHDTGRERDYSPFGYARRNSECERMHQLLLDYDTSERDSLEENGVPSEMAWVRDELINYLSKVDEVTPLAAVYIKHIAIKGWHIERTTRGTTQTVIRRRLKPCHTQYYWKCVDELRHMKRDRFYEEISFSNILYLDIPTMRGLLRNESLVNAFITSHYRDKYPLYKGTLVRTMKRACGIEQLYMNCEKILQRLFNLPFEIGREILKMLYVKDVRSLKGVIPEEMIDFGDSLAYQFPL